jgi:hypothetical protein
VPDLQQLPSLVALPLQEAAAEPHPVLRLHRLCDAAEILSRFCTILALSEVRSQLGDNPLPEPLLRRIQPQIQRPTWGQWLGMLEAFAELARTPAPVLPELLGFVQDHLLALAPAGDNPENSLLSLRNVLAHGGAMRSVHAAAFLTAWEARLAEALAHLSFLAGAEVYHLGGGLAHRLVGPTPHANSPARPVAELLPTRDVAALEGHVVLIRGGALLDLWPLCDYDRARMRGVSGPREASQPGPLLYLRAEHDLLLYSALGVDLPLGEKSDGLAAFRALFRLDDRIDPSRPVEGDFETEIRLDSAALVGRASELKHAKDALKAAQTGVFWLSGPGGIGKSFLAARLAHDSGNDPERACRIAWRFKIGDQSRGNRVAFLRHAVGKLAAWKHLNKTGLSLSFEADKLLDQLRGLLDEAATLAPRSERERPPRVLFILDGLDEIARLDEGFVRLPFELNRPNVVWLCAGRPEGLVDVFAPNRCTHVIAGGLPRMSPEDIRGMLLDRTGKLKYDLLQLDREKPDQVTNDAVEAVVARADGLPLYVHFVVEDILSGHFTVDERLARELPPGLSAYYAELLRRVQISSLQATLTPLLVTIAWAKAPLDQETLHLLMVRRKVLDDSEAGRTLLRQGLEALQGMVRLAPVAGTDHLGYELYHPTFREHIHNDPQGTLAMQNQLARQELCGLVREWTTISQAHGARAYVLRHGVGHVLEEPDLAGARELVRSEFLLAQADALDDAVALVAGRQLAERLADAGESGDDLVRCAFQYCTLAERLRGDPPALEDFIRREQWDRVQAVFDAEPGEPARGLLLLAAAELCRAAGRPQRAADLRGKAEPVVRRELEASLGYASWSGPETCLARLLLQEPSAIPSGNPVREESPDRADPGACRETSPRRGIPFDLLLLAYLGQMWVAVLGVFGMPGSYVLLRLLGVLGWPFSYWEILLVVVLFFSPALLIFASARLLLLQARRMTSVLERLEAAYEAGTSRERQTILLRALHFNRLLFEADRGGERIGEKALARMLRGSVENDPPDFAGPALRRALPRTEALRAALLAALDGLEANRRAAVLRAAVETAPGDGEGGWFLELLVRLAGRHPVAPELLAVAARTAARPEGPWGPVERALSARPPDELARVLLSPGLRFIGELRGFGRHGSGERLFLRSLSPLEPLVWLVVALPALVGCAVAVLFAAGIVAIGCVGLLLFALIGIAGRVWDPLRVAREAGQPPGPLKERILGSLHKENSWRYTAPFQARRLEVALIAHSLAEAGRGGRLPGLERWPLATVRRTLGALVRRGLVPWHGAVLASMSDRLLLRLTVSYRPRSHRGEAARLPDLAAAEGQIARALPLPSKRRHFLWVLGLSLLGLATWAAAFGLACLAEQSPLPKGSVLLAALVGCLVLAVLQHWGFFRPGEGEDNGEFFAHAVLSFFALCLSACGVFLIEWLLFGAPLDWGSGPRGGAGLTREEGQFLLWFGLCVTVALLIANLLAPEVIARWRGANLLFPTGRQLRRQRLFLVPAAIALCLLLGWLTALLARWVTPAW